MRISFNLSEAFILNNFDHICSNKLSIESLITITVFSEVRLCEGNLTPPIGIYKLENWNGKTYILFGFSTVWIV